MSKLPTYSVFMYIMAHVSSSYSVVTCRVCVERSYMYMYLDDGVIEVKVVDGNGHKAVGQRGRPRPLPSVAIIGSQSLCTGQRRLQRTTKGDEAGCRQGQNVHTLWKTMY